ncbi:MAG: hypothetical protein P4L46_01540 [Fimbriimonas sp.]|nr:hypothetical protein [Fimbriimonas sp.]
MSAPLVGPSGDASAHTWLPIDGVTNLDRNDPSVAPVDAFLGKLRANFRPVVCCYEGSNLQASRPLPGGKLEFANSKWTLTVGVDRVVGAADARDMTLAATLQEGEAPSSGIAAAFDFKDWSTGNYVLIPASIYNGNRNRIVNRGYAEGLDPQDYYRKDLPLTHGSVPCLALEKGSPSKLEVNASNASTPAVCIFDKRAKRGFILLAEQAGRNGAGDFLRKSNGEILDSAFSVEESTDRTRATVAVSAPGVREQKPEFIGFSKSPDRGIPLKAGSVFTLKLRVYNFPAADIPAVLEKFMTVRKALTGPNHPRLLLPASESLNWMVDRIEQRFLVTPDVSFYRCENGPWIAFGWISGWMNTFPMLALGDQAHLNRVTQTFDYGLKAQEPSGWFHYAIDDKGDVAFREPKKDMNLTRTHGDVLFWMIKQFQVLKAQGRGKAIKPEWETAMRKLAEAAVTTWKKNGQWGKMVNVKTGDVSEYNTSGGVMLISGLALASTYFHEPEYLEIAKEAATFYYTRDFVKRGQTTGGCADILQNADSETAFGFCTALMALYDVTGDRAWLLKSRQLANLAATWTVSYDYELPKFTALGALGTRLAGAVWASTQNKHSAPGYCTGSGDPLLKIYRATGDARYADLLRDILRAHDEAFYGGGGTERLTYCDADSRGANYHGSNGWTECNGAMMALEIPGIYVRTDIDRAYVFDAVKAKVLSRSADGVELQITNPTKFDANVAIFAENRVQAKQPQRSVAFLDWPKRKVKPGETVVIRVGAGSQSRVASLGSSSRS